MAEDKIKKEKTDHGDEPDNKQKIFDAAVKLFAQKGFAATGMRELAREAGVNLAMINYFYGSKINLLHAILDLLYDGIEQVMKERLTGEGPFEERLSDYIRQIITFLTDHSDLALIALTQIPLDKAETRGYKASKVSKIFEFAGITMRKELGESWGVMPPIHIFGPAIVGLMLSHFLFRPIMDEMGFFKFDDDFYEAYPEIISRIALHGLMGLGHPDMKPLLEKVAPAPISNTPEDVTTRK